MLQMQENLLCVVKSLVLLNPKIILGIAPFAIEKTILWSIAIKNMAIPMLINLLLLQMLLTLKVRKTTRGGGGG